MIVRAKIKIVIICTFTVNRLNKDLQGLLI
jgi:hypothetical protein